MFEIVLPLITSRSAASPTRPFESPSFALYEPSAFAKPVNSTARTGEPHVTDLDIRLAPEFHEHIILCGFRDRQLAHVEIERPLRRHVAVQARERLAAAPRQAFR